MRGYQDDRTPTRHSVRLLCVALRTRFMTGFLMFVKVSLCKGYTGTQVTADRVTNERSEAVQNQVLNMMVRSGHEPGKSCAKTRKAQMPYLRHHRQFEAFYNVCGLGSSVRASHARL